MLLRLTLLAGLLDGLKISLGESKIWVERALVTEEILSEKISPRARCLAGSAQAVNCRHVTNTRLFTVGSTASIDREV